MDSLRNKKVNCYIDIILGAMHNAATPQTLLSRSNNRRSGRMMHKQDWYLSLSRNFSHIFIWTSLYLENFSITHYACWHGCLGHEEDPLLVILFNRLFQGLPENRGYGYFLHLSRLNNIQRANQKISETGKLVAAFPEVEVSFNNFAIIIITS